MAPTAAIRFGTGLAGKPHRAKGLAPEERILPAPLHPRKSWLAALLLGAFAAQPVMAIESYPGDPGALGDPASWRTPEFNRDWGLRSIGAEYAYAAGFSGAGVRIGAVDSGYFALHPQLPASRYQGVTVHGIPGIYSNLYNDSHGTHVTGTIAAARDGSIGGDSNFHGVAFSAQLLSGNTHKTDAVLFGMPQATQTPAQTLEQGYVADVYRALNAQNVRVISSSWGSQPNTEQYQTLFPTTGPNLTGRAGLMGAWGFLVSPGTWFQGALDAAKSGTIIVFSAGNSGYANPSARAAAPYFMPELEKNWLGVSGIRQALTIGGVQVGQSLNPDGSVNVPGAQLYNQCGIAKWSCVTAPGNAINGSTVTAAGGGVNATYGSLSGTSMSAPHASGAIAVLAERFPYMSNEQLLSVLKTTAVQNGTINDAAGVAIANPTAGQRVEVPDDRNGWGTVSLRHAREGPGQFTDRFAVNTQGRDDTWSNSISDTAIKARGSEDQAEAAQWNATKAARGWQNGLPAGASDDDRTEFNVGMARELARQMRVYEGSLAKLGDGMLTLSGENSFSGGSEVLGGTLVAASATALGSGDVAVSGGTLATRSDETVRIGGDLTLGAGSILDLGFGFADGPLLDIDGLMTFGGLLSISFLDGFLGVGLYELIDFGSFAGAFSGFAFNGLSPAYAASLVFGSDGVALSVTPVPEPETYALMLMGLGVVGWLSRRRKRG